MITQWSARRPGPAGGGARRGAGTQDSARDHDSELSQAHSLSVTCDRDCHGPPAPGRAVTGGLPGH
jgi:hypothetical protein